MSVLMISRQIDDYFYIRQYTQAIIMNEITTINQSLADVERAVDTRRLRPSTRSKYIQAAKRAFDAGVSFRDDAALIAYANTLPTSSRAFLKSVYKVWAADHVKQSRRHLNQMRTNGATPAELLAAKTHVDIYASAIDAISEDITIDKKSSTRSHKWLTQSEVQRLVQCCNASTNAGARNLALIALMIGCGMRRDEARRATWADIKTDNGAIVKWSNPDAMSSRMFIFIDGKGDKERKVHINAQTVKMLSIWRDAVGDPKRSTVILRRVNKMGSIGAAGIGGQSIYDIVCHLGECADIDGLRPHDMRRTFAQLLDSAGVPVRDISLQLGHASIKTTERYLDKKSGNFDTSAIDFGF